MSHQPISPSNRLAGKDSQQPKSGTDDLDKGQLARAARLSAALSGFLA